MQYTMIQHGKSKMQEVISIFLEKRTFCGFVYFEIYIKEIS